VEFTYPAKVRFECSRCGLCCGDTEHKKRHILLLEAEAKQIASDTSKQIDEFAQPIQCKQPYTFEMKKGSDGKCLFLKENQCSIYQSRPLICRFYPFDLRFDQEKQVHNFDFTVECPGINSGEVKGKKDFKNLFALAQEKLG